VDKDNLQGSSAARGGSKLSAQSIEYQWVFPARPSSDAIPLLLWIAIPVPGNSFTAVAVSEAIKLADEQFFV